jgi:hypothetical protein
MIVSARDPFHVNKKITYNKCIQSYPDKPDVWVYKQLEPTLRMKILSYLSNPEVEKTVIEKARERYDYMNSEIIIYDSSLETYNIIQYKWCKYCGERSKLFAKGYNCDCDIK